jgi:hypothetical protein
MLSSARYLAVRKAFSLSSKMNGRRVCAFGNFSRSTLYGSALDELAGLEEILRT